MLTILVRLCIWIGSLFLRFFDYLLFPIFELIFLLRNFVSDFIFIGIKKLGRSIWYSLKKSNQKPQPIFSLSYYLFFYRVKYFTLGFLLAFLLFLVQQVFLFINNLPSINLLESDRSAVSTHIYDRNGKLLYEIFREQNRTPVKLSKLPKYVTQATISIEDKDFYKHSGVSFFSGILRAIKDTILRKKLQGGSTITQQLVKSALLTPERTLERKIKEIILALLVERRYTKDQILEMYLNQVPYGGTAWGIEEASKLYFGKSAYQLSLSEAALLAGLPQAPSLYSPFTNPQAAKNRQLEVLESMYKAKYIDLKTLTKAKKHTFKL